MIEDKNDFLESDSLQIKIKEKLSIFLTENQYPLKNIPGDGSKFMIRKNLDELVSLDINTFTNTNFIKYKGLCKLYHIIFLSEGKITPYFEKIFKTLTKFIFHEDKDIIKQVRVISEVLGIFIDAEVYIPIVLHQINELDISAIKSLTSFIVYLTGLLKYERGVYLDRHLPHLIKILEILENNYREENDILYTLFDLTSILIKNSGESIIVYTRQLFSVLLTVQSSTLITSELKQNILNAMDILAKKSGYESITDLHTNEISVQLKEILENKSYVKWNRHSRERFKFDVIVRNCREGIGSVIDDVLEIIRESSIPDKDIELRMDMLVLLEFILGLKKIDKLIMDKSEYIILRILIPAAVWRAGKPQIKIRKAAIINVLNLINNEIVEPNTLHKLFKDLIPVIKSCIEDDWAPDLRFATCNLIEKILVSLNTIIDSDQLRDIYPTLLERLDDAQDIIRIEISKALISFFACKNMALSESTFEYVVKAIFVHLDDQNEEIQLVIFNVLKFAAKLRPEIVLEEGKKNIKKQKYPRKCQELINFSEEKIEENKSIIQEEIKN